MEIVWGNPLLFDKTLHAVGSPLLLHSSSSPVTSIFGHDKLQFKSRTSIAFHCRRDPEAHPLEAAKEAQRETPIGESGASFPAKLSADPTSQEGSRHESAIEDTIPSDPAFKHEPVEPIQISQEADVRAFSQPKRDPTSDGQQHLDLNPPLGIPPDSEAQPSQVDGPRQQQSPPGTCRSEPVTEEARETAGYRQPRKASAVSDFGVDKCKNQVAKDDSVLAKADALTLDREQDEPKTAAEPKLHPPTASNEESSQSSLLASNSKPAAVTEPPKTPSLGQAASASSSVTSGHLLLRSPRPGSKRKPGGNLKKESSNFNPLA